MVFTARQRAAAMKNLKKAHAAAKHNPKRRKAATHRRRK